MKIFSFVFVVILYTASVFAQNGKINVTITGIENSDGVVEIGIYSRNITFPTFGKEMKGVKIKPKKTGSINYIFKNIPDGVYAIAVLLDENGNHKIDKNFFGVPKEKYGFSKNIFGTFGPPNFEDVSFTIQNENIVTLTINLK